MCYAAQREDIPEPTRVALSCAQNAEDWRRFAGCVVGSKLNIGGDLGKITACAAANGGDPITTAACSAYFDLTPEQQIAIQCASQSSDAMTFVACTGGQLTLREYMKCQGKAVAQEDCFGPNNEIRKFVRNMGLGDIQENTVVAQALNFQLDVVKTQVTFAESALQTSGKVGEDVLRGASALATNLGNAASQGAQTVAGALQSAGDAVKSFFGL